MSPIRRRPRTAGALRRPSAALGLATASLLLAAAPGAGAKTLIGTPSPDRLVGTPSADLLFGGGGADRLLGGGGNDIIFGVRSDNLIKAGGGNNYVEGGTGNDTITAGRGNNTVYGGTGRDKITLGNGNNYVDPGAADDRVTLGNGNNVVNGGGGGLILRAGSGRNTVYYRSGPDDIQLGGGINTVYVATVGEFARIDCGGNPQSRLLVNRLEDPTLAQVLSARTEGKVVGCPTIAAFDGPTVPPSQTATPRDPFVLTGTDGPDQLYGGHGGGLIDGRGGDNVLWADRVPNPGGAKTRSKTTTILAGNGDNEVYGGRGTNIITVGNGHNFIRAGAYANTITVGRGRNVIRLRGRGRNVVTINGGSAYVESFVRRKVPAIHCRRGAKGTVVYGVLRPRTNCSTVVPASSKRGQRLQVRGIDRVRDSDAVVFAPVRPGAPGVGVPRPAL